jgi:flagellin
MTMTNQKLQQAQTRIATGMRVATAQDNAAYWSIATTMRADAGALSTVADALGLGSATVDVVYTALSASVELVSKVQEKLMAARNPGVDKSKIQTEITELQRELSGVASAAVFSGENWLSVNSGLTSYNATKQVVASFSRSGGTVTIGTISININSLKLYDTSATVDGILDGTRNSAGALSSTGTLASIASLNISALTDSAADILTLESYITAAGTALGEMTTAATALGAVQSRIALQKNFVSTLMDAIEQGIGQLVDADMNEESTKLQALQVQAQLGIQALNIANQTSQNILSLFQ